MPRIDAFEQYSDVYDDWFARHPQAYAAELKAIRQLLPAGKGMEVGVGSGKFAAPLGIRVGVEPSRQMAAKAEQLGIRVVHGVAESLPFAAEEFDFVLMVTTICFVDDLPQSLREALRVLKSGGCLLTGFVDKESELGQQYQENRGKSRFYGEATFYASDEVIALLGAAGFGALEIVQTLIPGEPDQTVREGYGAGAFVVIKALKEAAA